jgi:hypothetical protein
MPAEDSGRVIICKPDVVRHTDDLDRLGHIVTVEIRAQLDAMVGRLLDLPNENAPTQLVKDTINPFVPEPLERFRGQRQGDGVMVGAPRIHAITMLRIAMTIRDEGHWQHPTWRRYRLAMGIARVNWDRDPYGLGSVPNGWDINVIARLERDQCPPGSIVINAGLMQEVKQYAHDIYPLFESRSAELMGIEGLQTFGILPPRAHLPVEALRTQWRLFLQDSWLPAALTAGVTVVGSLAWAYLAWRLWP